MRNMSEPVWSGKKPLAINLGADIPTQSLKGRSPREQAFGSNSSGLGEYPKGFHAAGSWRCLFFCCSHVLRWGGGGNRSGHRMVFRFPSRLLAALFICELLGCWPWSARVKVGAGQVERQRSEGRPVAISASAIMHSLFEPIVVVIGRFILWSKAASLSLPAMSWGRLLGRTSTSS